MTRKCILYAAMALLASTALSSCQKEQGPANPDEGLKSIALSINLGSASTKTARLEDAWKTDFKDFSNLDIYFTDVNGNIMYYYRAEGTAEPDTDSKIIWDGLNDNTSGVRFIGMEGVSQVYVVANGKQIDNLKDVAGALPEGTNTNISELNTLTQLTYYTGDQNSMVYAGATQNLELASGSISETAGIIKVGEEGGQDYKADVYIRPAVSRLEVNTVSVKTSGEVYYKYEDGDLVKTTDADAEYKVTYSDFLPELVGVYASNVYRNAALFPAQTSISGDWGLFETPQNTANPISEGKWVSLSSETDLNNYLSQAKYNSGYEIFASDYKADAASGDKYILFDGDKSGKEPKVVPFNFFVPYNVTDKTDVNALSGTAVPALHFQFKKPNGGYTIMTYKKDASDPSGWTAITDSKLTATVDWPTVAEGEQDIAFANVVKYTTESSTGPALELKPGYIYRVQEVLVDPTNISVSTKDTNKYNVYVVVTVVPFTEENVYPGFE